MLKQKVPIVVIDGMGTWWGLRVSKDEENPGLPIVVFGGEHADLPLNPDKAPQIARAIVETNISAVLDLSNLSKTKSRKVVQEFLDELYQRNRAERHIFLEETDMFAPQKPIGPEMAMCLSSVDNFVRRGGNHNLGCTMITQRSAVLNKDILTQSDCLAVLRTLAPQDKKAIQLWVEEQTDDDPDKLAAWYDSLKNLENGEAWVWHPENPAIYQRTTFRPRETFHATRQFLLSPKASTIKLMDVREFVEKFSSVFGSEKKPKEPTGETTSRREAELAEKLALVERQLGKEMDLRAQAEDAYRKGMVEKDQTIATLETAIKSLAPLRDFIRAEIQELIPELPAPSNSTSPTTITVTGTQPKIIWSEERHELKLTDKDLRGKITLLYAKGEIPEKEWFTTGTIHALFKKHAWGQDPRASQALDEFTTWGFFEKGFAGARPQYRMLLAPFAAKERGLISKEG
mgnify:FL=1